MPFTVGSQVGPYQILAELGAGGMGVVYRARDSRLGRDVAIKVSARQFAERFEREARAVAALNHPNICTLHDVGPDYLVMELVEGRTLADVLDARPSSSTGLPVDEAIQLARQIGAALDAAHEKGIVHRDLKPGNIKITADGTVKVLDFGLARIDGVADAGRVSGADDPTVSPAGLVTQAGVILGTAAYMSPEQARGKTTDRRADIWAFGVVFYELLTGRRPFGGSDVPSTIAAVIQTEPQWDGVPPELQRLLKKCLEKDPKRRLRDIGDVWDLQSAAVQSAQAPGRSGRLGWVAAAIMALASVVTIWGPWRSAAPAPSLVRGALDLGSNVLLPPLTLPTPSSFAISPDASRLVYVAGISGGPLYVQRLDQMEAAAAVALAGTEGAGIPYFSSDGRNILFSDGSRLKRVGVDGGEVQVLTELEMFTGADWIGDQLIVTSGLSPSSGLLQVPPAGGATTSILAAGVTEILVGPHLLPGARDAFVTVYGGGASPSPGQTAVDIVSLADRSRKTVIPRGKAARYLSTGHVIYSDRSTLFAVPFDLAARELRGEPVAVLQDVAYDLAAGSPQFSISRTGMLVYRRAIDESVRRTALLTATGLQPLPLPPKDYRISPDGTKIAYVLPSPTGQQDVWVYDLVRDSAPIKLTQAEATFFSPIWSRDSQHLVIGTIRKGLFWVRADGGMPPQQLVPSERVLAPVGFGVDDARLAYLDLTGTEQLWTMPIARSNGLKVGGAAEAYLPSVSIPERASFSPDGRWLAYQSNENGRAEIHVRAFPDNGKRVTISGDGGTGPFWRENEILYLSGGKIMSVAYTTRGGFLVPEKPQVWQASAGRIEWFSAAATGKRAIVTEGPAHAEHSLVVIPNFFDELRRRAPIGR